MNQAAASPKISVVIPVKNASRTIGDCLDAVYLNNDVDFEVIVVDDGCADNTMDIVSKYNCMALKNNVRGVSGARNTGASSSKGDIFVFIDADIIVPKNTLSKILERFQCADIAAVVGMLSENIRFNDFPSQYKNLWMNYTFNNLPDNISLIFSSIAAIKKDIFLKCGGFDANYKTPNVEDNELGIRLSSAGHNIVLDKTLQVEHLKKYTFFSLLKTHYFRAKGLIKLYNRKKIIGLNKNNPTSVPDAYLFNLPLAAVLAALLLSFLSAGRIPLKVILVLAVFLCFFFINRRWLAFLKNKRGVFFALRSLFYLPLEAMVILAGLGIGQSKYFSGKRY